MSTARHGREAPGHQASGTFSPWARGPRWPRFLSCLATSVLPSFPRSGSRAALAYSSFHRGLDTGHRGEQPVSTYRTSGLSARYPGQVPRPSRVLRPQLAEGGWPAGLPAGCPCSGAGTWWAWLPWGLLGRLGVFRPRPSDPLCTLPWPPGQLCGSHSAVSVKSVWLKSRIFSGE